MDRPYPRARSRADDGASDFAVRVAPLPDRKQYSRTEVDLPLGTLLIAVLAWVFITVAVGYWMFSAPSAPVLATPRFRLRGGIPDQAGGLLLTQPDASGVAEPSAAPPGDGPVAP